MVRQTARSIIFILFCCSFLFPANGGVGQECEAIKDIDLDWMYKKETLNLPPFNPDLPRSIQWSKEGHSLAYLISNVTEAPHLVVYDPAKDATAFLVTPHALHEAVIALASQPEGVTIEAACAMRTVPEGATDVASIDWYEWQSETMGIRLHSQGKTYTWDMEVNLLKEEPTDARKLPEGEKNDTEYSPNERYAAYTRANDLYVFDLEQMKELRLTEDGSVSILNGRMTWVYWEELHYRRGWGAFIWSPNNDALAYLQFNEQGVSTYPVTDFSNPVPNTLNMFYPKVGTKNPDVRLGVVTLSTRDTRWIDLGEPDEYIARVAWTPDGQTLAVQTLNREQTRLTLRFADPWTGRSRVILQEEDPAWVNAHGGPYFLEEQDGFLWFSERSGYRHLYKYSLDGSQCTQLTQGEWEVNPSLWQIGVDLDEKNNRVLFNANESSPLEKQYYAVSLDGGNLQRLTQDAGMHSVSFSADYQYAIDRYNNTTTPNTIRLLDSQGKILRVLGETTVADYAPYRIKGPEFFEIQNQDGLVYHAHINKPFDFDPQKKYPVVVEVYGGPAGQVVTNSWVNPQDMLFVNRGFLYVGFDTRGTPGAGGHGSTPSITTKPISRWTIYACWRSICGPSPMWTETTLGYGAGAMAAI